MNVHSLSVTGRLIQEDLKFEAILGYFLYLNRGQEVGGRVGILCLEEQFCFSVSILGWGGSFADKVLT